MSIEVTKNGVLKIIQGDTGSIVVDGIPTDKSYEVYLAIRNPETRELVFEELKIDSEGLDEVEFEITKAMSEKLEVPINRQCSMFYWGVKLCDPDTGLEDTLRVGECRCCDGGYFGKWNRLYVYPKIVEGIVDATNV